MKTLSKPFHLAGVKYAKEESNITLPLDLARADVRIMHNPLNPYDPFALEVRINGHMCGHIPRTEQGVWVYHTLQGVPVKLQLLEFDRSKPHYEQIRGQFVCEDRYMTNVTKLTTERE